jgi:hypothetical protein
MKGCHQVSGDSLCFFDDCVSISYFCRSKIHYASLFCKCANIFESSNCSNLIKLQTGDPNNTKTNGAEFVAVDKYGNIYGSEPGPQKLQKYERVR